MAFNRNIPNNGLPLLPPEIEGRNSRNSKETGDGIEAFGRAKWSFGATLTDPTLLINTQALQESKDSSELENIITTQDELYEAITGNGNVNAAAIEVLNYTEGLYGG